MGLGPRGASLLVPMAHRLCPLMTMTKDWTGELPFWLSKKASAWPGRCPERPEFGLGPHPIAAMSTPGVGPISKQKGRRRPAGLQERWLEV